MSKIRSALEIALERTESVESNPEKVLEEQTIQEGQRMISKFLFEKALTIDNLKESLEDRTEKERTFLITGMANALVSNISLPQNDMYTDQLNGVKTAVKELTGNEEVDDYFLQLDSFFQQYLNHLQQLRSSLEQQHAPKLKQKQQQLAQQYGTMVELTPDQDPEFLDMYNKQRQRLEEQYRGSLEDFKHQIQQMIINAYSSASS